MKFINLVGILLLIISCSSMKSAQVQPAKGKKSILQGVTTASETRIVILHLKDDKFSLSVTSDHDDKIELTPVMKSVDYSPWSITQLNIKKLRPSYLYTLKILNEKGEVTDARTFHSLDLNKPKVKFAFVSCMDDGYVEEQAKMWKSLMNKKPELLFMIGDNVYPDKGLGYNKATPPETLWSRYVETRNTLEIYFAQELIPIIATWDDHDYGINDGDRKYPYKEESKKTFFSFFAQEQSEGTTYESSGLGVASLLKGFGFQFYLMDDRYFRSAPQEANTETHWGIEQENWLNSHLKQDKSPAWILNGDQFFGAYHKFESYEGRHPENFKKLLGQWKNLKTPLVLLSGDRHLAELMAISKKEFGQNTFEITSSAIHAKTFPDAWKDSPNPRQMAGASGFFNYAVIEATSKPKFSFDVTAYGPEEKVLFEKKNLKVTF